MILAKKYLALAGGIFWLRGPYLAHGPQFADPCAIVCKLVKNFKKGGTNFLRPYNY